MNDPTFRAMADRLHEDTVWRMSVRFMWVEVEQILREANR